jgi:hypothetical protein
VTGPIRTRSSWNVSIVAFVWQPNFALTFKDAQTFAELGERQLERQGQFMP